MTKNATFQPVTRKRTGSNPISFSGRLIREVSGRQLVGAKRRRDDASDSPINRWHEVELWETDGGKLLAAVAYKTIWDGESDHYTVLIGPGAAELLAALNRYDATEHVQGFPAIPRYVDRQRRLLKLIGNQWRDVLAEVSSDEVFAETI